MSRKTSPMNFSQASDINGKRNVDDKHSSLELENLSLYDETKEDDTNTEGAHENRRSQSGCENPVFTMSDEGRNSVNMIIGANGNEKTPEEVSDNHSRKLFNFLIQLKRRAKLWTESNRKYLSGIAKVLTLVLYNVYLGFAVRLTWIETPSWCDGVKFLILITAIVYLTLFTRYLLRPFVLTPLRRAAKPIIVRITHFKHSSKLIWSVIWAAIAIFLIVDSQNNLRRLTSAAGLLIFLFLGYVFSVAPSKIVWKHINCGILMQFLMGLLILRWPVGREVFQCLGNKVAKFLEFTDAGSSFVFGYLVTGKLNDAPPQDAIFAFKVLTVVIFFSSIVSILYYFGLMQIIVKKVGWCLQVTVGTTACESMNAAGNIFLGMTESPLMIAPYLSQMTKSELHAVLTGGFATIAGSVLAAYINFGISPTHLLTASVMSAPAALAYSKLMYPETEESLTTSENIKIEKPSESNALEAASNGASSAISLISNIVANLIAAVSFIAFLDSLFSWFGSLVHFEFITFDWLMSKIFIPFSLIMGVEWKDREPVANLLGLKTVVNEFVAYRKLAEFQKENLISARSEAIATYALCGFSNIGSIGIQIGALGALVPERKSEVASLAWRAMIAGSVACFMTACVAGALLKEVD